VVVSERDRGTSWPRALTVKFLAVRRARVRSPSCTRAFRSTPCHRAQSHSPHPLHLQHRSCGRGLPARHGGGGGLTRGTLRGSVEASSNSVVGEHAADSATADEYDNEKDTRARLERHSHLISRSPGRAARHEKRAPPPVPGDGAPLRSCCLGANRASPSWRRHG
jgi:hypothetical protein